MGSILKVERIEKGWGLTCPNCGRTGIDGARDSRKVEGGVRRRRECTECGTLFTTYEVVVPDNLNARDWGKKAMDSLKGDGKEAVKKHIRETMDFWLDKMGDD